MNGPWHVQSRLKLAILAREFFDVRNLDMSYAAIGSRLPTQDFVHGLSVGDFVEYLRARKAFEDTPDAFRVARLLAHFASTGLLVRTHAHPSPGGLNDSYQYLPHDSDSRRQTFRYVPALGPELLYGLCNQALVHITGKNCQGDAVAGTGLIVHSRHVLTCRHVVEDMRVDPTQTFQQREYDVAPGSFHLHPQLDIAVVRLDGPCLRTLDGALWRSPVVGEDVHTLGYPKLPGLRDATVTMQPGAVTNPAVTTLGGERLFLYSAITRPGNSGGPVFSRDGYVVGICSADSTAKYDSVMPFSPHYTGIPADIVVAAVAELDLGFELPLERWE